MSERPEQRCGRCRYWPRYLYAEINNLDDAGISGKGESHCQRRAPTLAHGWSAWPVTSATDWCGEWEARAPHDPLFRDERGVSRKMRDYLARIANNANVNERPTNQLDRNRL